MKIEYWRFKGCRKTIPNNIETCDDEYCSECLWGRYIDTDDMILTGMDDEINTESKYRCQLRKFLQMKKECNLEILKEGDQDITEFPDATSEINLELIKRGAPTQKRVNPCKKYVKQLVITGIFKGRSGNFTQHWGDFTSKYPETYIQGNVLHIPSTESNIVQMRNYYAKYGIEVKEMK